MSDKAKDSIKRSTNEQVYETNKKAHIEDKQIEKVNNSDQDDYGDGEIDINIIDPKTDKAIEIENFNAIEFYHFILEQIKRSNKSKSINVVLDLKDDDNDDNRIIIKLFELGINKFESDLKKQDLESVLSYLLLKLEFSLSLKTLEPIMDINLDKYNQFNQEPEFLFFKSVFQMCKIYFEISTYVQEHHPYYGQYEIESKEGEVFETKDVLNNKSILPNNIDLKGFDDVLIELEDKMPTQKDYSQNTNFLKLFGFWTHCLLAIHDLPVIKRYQQSFVINQIKRLTSILSLFSEADKLPLNEDLDILNFNLYKFYERFNNNPSLIKLILEFIIISYEQRVEKEEADFSTLQFLGRAYITHSKVLELKYKPNLNEEELDDIAQSYAQGLDYLYLAAELEPDNEELKDYIKDLEKVKEESK